MGLVEGVRAMPKAVLPCNGPSKSQLSMHNTKKERNEKGVACPEKCSDEYTATGHRACRLWV